MAMSDTADPDFTNNQRTVELVTCTQLGTAMDDVLTGTGSLPMSCVVLAAQTS